MTAEIGAAVAKWLTRERAVTGFMAKTPAEKTPADNAAASAAA